MGTIDSGNRYPNRIPNRNLPGYRPSSFSEAKWPCAAGAVRGQATPPEDHDLDYDVDYEKEIWTGIKLLYQTECAARLRW